MKYMLSWDIKEMFNALNDVLEGKENALIEWFGREHWDRLVEEAKGDIDVAVSWAKHVLKNDVKATYQLLETIYKETKDNEIVQKRLEAVGFTPQDDAF